MAAHHVSNEDIGENTRRPARSFGVSQAATTDDGPFNGLLERPALRSLVPASLAGAVVLDAGCVVESGPHRDLLAAGGRYAHLWRLQSQTPAQPHEAVL